MQLSRESILRMFEGSGSGGSGGGAGSSQMAAMLQGYATQSWVDENYVGIEFFNRLFRMHGANDTVIVPNDLDTTIQNIEARFGLWTESFLSALGLNIGGGGGGSVSYLNDLLDVSITNPTVGEGLVYDGTRWVNGPIGGGGTGSVESVGLSMPTGFSVTGSPVTTSGTLAVGFASGYSLPPTSKQAQWDTAYSWGDHSQEGYATQSWVNAKGYTTNTGTVTSVRMTVPAGLTVTGSPITTSGTLAISLGVGYSIPTTAKQSQWDTAYGWGNHADAGYAAQTALAAAVTRITTLEGYFTNGVANQAARLSGSSTYQAWGQEYWRNGHPLSISGRLSSVTDIMMSGSVNVSGDGGLNYLVGQNYISAILRNSTYKQLVVGYGTSQSGYNLFLEGKDVEVRLWDVNAFKTPLVMSLDGNHDPYVQVDKTLRIGDGNGHYFPVTYDYANNALCFSGDIYATGGVSALGFSSTTNGGALISGALEVQSSATIGGTLTVNGQTTTKQLRATGAVTCTSSLSVSGMVSVGGRFVIDNDADDIAIVWNGREYYLDVQAMINNGFLV